MINTEQKGTIVSKICYQNTIKGMTCNKDYIGKKFFEHYTGKPEDKETTSPAHPTWIAYACLELADRLDEFSKEQIIEELHAIANELQYMTNTRNQRRHTEDKRNRMLQLCSVLYGPRRNFKLGNKGKLQVRPIAFLQDQYTTEECGKAIALLKMFDEGSITFDNLETMIEKTKNI